MSEIIKPLTELLSKEELHDLYTETVQDYERLVLSRDKEVMQYRNVLQEIVSLTKYEGNQWYEKAKEVLKD